MNTNSNVKEDKNKKVIKGDMKKYYLFLCFFYQIIFNFFCSSIPNNTENDNSKVSKNDLNQSGTSNRKKDKDKNKNCCIL